MSLKKRVLLTNDQQTKVVTNESLAYFAAKFNELISGKVQVVTNNLEVQGKDIKDLRDALDAHLADTTVHITTEERAKWDAYQSELEALEQLITGKSAVDVVANLEALNKIEAPKVGDLVYVLDTTGHPEGGEKQALGFIYAEIDGQPGWHLFTDLEPSLHAKDLAVDTIAGVEGSTVQAVLESLATKLSGGVQDLQKALDDFKAEIEGKLDDAKAELEGKIADEAAEREAADTALEEAINVVNGKVTDLQNKVNSDKAELEAKIQEVQGKVDAETTAREEAIEEVKGQVSDLDAKVDQAVDNINGEIAGLKEKDTFLESEIARVEGDLTALAGRVEANEGAIEELQTDVEAIKGRIDDLEAQVGEDLQQKIQELRDELTALITALDARVTALEGRADAVEGRLDVVEGEVDTLQGQVTTIEGKLADIEEGAEVNQNAFSKITVGGVEVAATEKEDTFELAVDPGLLIRAEGKKITVSLDIIENSEIDEIIAALNNPSRRR